MIATVSEKWSARYVRIWLDGIEITKDCRYANEERGMVQVVARYASGEIRTNDYEYGVEWDVKFGKVKIALRENAPDWAKEIYNSKRNEIGAL